MTCLPQAGGLVGSCGPVGRRTHCLVGVQGRFLLLHGGYSGTCELLQDAWLYDTRRDCWMQVDLTGDNCSASARLMAHCAGKHGALKGQA